MSKHTPIIEPDFRKYVVTDPEAQPGLTPVIERGLVPVAYVNRYIAEKMVPCAFCDAHQPHLRGFTALMQDGRTALCGIDCGRRYFGRHAAQRLEQALAEVEEQRHQDELLALVMDGLPVAVEAIERWILVERQCIAVLDYLPKVSYSRAKRSLDQGIDYVFYRVEKQDRRRPDGSIVQVEVEVETGRVREVRLIWADKGYLSAALDLCNKIRSGANLKGRKATNEERLEMRENLIRKLREALDWFAMAQVFFKPDNLDRYCRLYRQSGDEGVKVEVKEVRTGMALRVRRDDVWATYPLPDLTAITAEGELLGPLRGSTGGA